MGSSLSLQAMAQEPSWQCHKGDLTGSWNCSLPDNAVPQDRIHRRLEKTQGWFSPAFSAAQEKVFTQLQLGFSQNPWAMCAGASTQPLYPYNKQLREQANTHIFANASESFDKQVTYFSGAVDLTRADQRTKASQAIHNKGSNSLNLFGDVLYRDSGTALYSASAKMELNQDKSLLRDSLFIVPTSPIRGSAEVIYRESSSLRRLKEVSYTSCPPNNQDWVLHAEKMKINDKTGSASIKQGWLEFKQVPVMYLPYGSFSIDDRRKSGFLMPSFGVSGRNGMDISVPFYWNIAPNYDLTLHPRYMGTRGFMMGADFRYLQDSYQGEVDVEVLPEDQLAKSESGTATTRWGGSVKHQHQFMDNLQLDVDANYVSDKAYVSDLEGNLGTGNRSQYLSSRLDLNYSLSWLSLQAHMDNYQNINPVADDSSLPYRRLPQIQLNLHKSMESFGVPVDFAWESEYVNFQRHSNDGNLEAQRLNVKPSISFPMRSDAGFMTPKIALQHTQYWLGEGDDSAQQTLSKTLPVISLDSGLFFEREFAQLRHTIEPRLYYLYVPYVNQEALPNFDTGVADFNTGMLFRDNRFNGVDKTENTNQITTALTTRLIKDGRELLNLTVGEIFYLESRKVGLSGYEPKNELVSNLIVEFSSELSREFRLNSSLHWNHKQAKIDRGAIDLRYHAKNNTLFNAGYRYRLERTGQVAQEQIMASAMLPIVDGWSFIGLYRYSLYDRMPLEHFFGIEKDSCCWRIRLIARQFIRNTREAAQKENSLFLQFELKGFTSLGEKLDDFLLENISGYSKPSDK